MGETAKVKDPDGEEYEVPAIRKDVWKAKGNCFTDADWNLYEVDGDGKITYNDCLLLESSMMESLGPVAADDRMGGPASAEVLPGTGEGGVLKSITNDPGAGV